ncbi:MAG: Rrf2 family transcriptional regulator [Arcobacter sp.]|nr:MAG: Rrf2 family transcriptional regulator [Arcobacter sp.]
MIGLTTKTIYAIAALNELSNLTGKEVLKIKNIASAANVPQNFLEQILLELRKRNILISIKGAHGGYKLAKKLSEIKLRDIIMVLETDAFSDICRTDNPVLKLFWGDIKKGVMDVFDISLSELKTYQQQVNDTLDYSI